MSVPNVFANATTSIPLIQLDQNFNTGITLGNTTVYLGNTTTSFGNVTLTGADVNGTVTLTTPLAVTSGGTGRTTGTTAYGLIAAGTTATGAQQTLSAGATTEILVGGGTGALPVWTTATGTGAPVRAGSPTFTGAVTENKRASVYQYTAWDPSDVAGSNTNAPATAAATSAATSYVTVANSSGTLTWTCVKDGVYRFTISGQNEYNNAITGANLNCDLGGTGTRYLGTNTAKIFSYVAGTLQPMCGTFVFYASMTAGQTVTTLPYFSVTSPGTTAQFTQQCTVACEYTGAS
jgi:hypothetical protein